MKKTTILLVLFLAQFAKADYTTNFVDLDQLLRAQPLPVSATITLDTSLLATKAWQESSDNSINSLLKPASTLNAVTTLGTITNALPSGTNVIGHVLVDSVSGSVTTTETRPSAAVVSSVASSASSVTCLASNASRRVATFFNDSTQTVYLKFGATAASNDYTVKIATQGFYEMPYPAYTGAVDCIWDSANGFELVTEY